MKQSTYPLAEDKIKDDEEVMEEAFGKEPITGHLLFGPRPDNLHERADSYDTSRWDHDYEGGPNGKSELAMHIHNDQGFQCFIHRLSASDQRYQNKRDELADDTGYIEVDPMTGRNEDLHRVRSEIADEIEKEMYNKLASRGAAEGQVDQDDFLRVQAELVTEYHTDVNRLDTPDYVDEVAEMSADKDDSRFTTKSVPVKSANPEHGTLYGFIDKTGLTETTFDIDSDH